MNPFSINPWVLLGGAAVVASVSFASAWNVQGWRKDAVISDMKREKAESIAQQSQVALSDLAEASKSVKEAAATGAANVSTITTQLSAIRKERKNAQQIPLPPDCRMDAPRVRSLNAITDAADKAISATGSVSSK